MWVFGYGSIIFRPGFSFLERHTGFVADVSRRFWQGSTDHRGVPGAPGRVVTLVDAPGERCWGVVYRLGGTEAEGVLGALDVREQGGYERRRVRVHIGRPGAPTERVANDVLTYLGTDRNPNYLGPAPLDDMARQIVRSRGPSGANLDYVVQLAEHLRALGLEDAHVFAVEAAVQAVLAELDGGTDDEPGAV